MSSLAHTHSKRNNLLLERTPNATSTKWINEVTLVTFLQNFHRINKIGPMNDYMKKKDQRKTWGLELLQFYQIYENEGPQTGKISKSRDHPKHFLCACRLKLRRQLLENFKFSTNWEMITWVIMIW